MFGFYRTFLALIVIGHHLLDIPIIGHYAVHGFFILSGYLMTLVMSNTYGYSWQGVKAFAINRFLRLYPTYWLLLMITVVLVQAFGSELTSEYRAAMFLPRSPFQWLQNISLVFINAFPATQLPRLSPPAWSLTTELLFYFGIALGLSRSKRTTLIWLWGSISYMVSTHFLALGYEYRYGMLFAGSLPFSMGAAVYHYRAALVPISRWLCRSFMIGILVALFAGNAFIASMLLGQRSEQALCVSYYLNYAINCLLIVSLMNFPGHFRVKKLDQKVGEISYPMYLFHWQAGFLASIALSRTTSVHERFSMVSFVLALAICCAVSWVSIKLLQDPVMALRERVKVTAKALKRQPSLSEGSADASRLEPNATARV